MELNEPSAELLKIPAIAAIATYLRDMAFSRKLFSGCDYAEVLECFAEVTYRYNSVLESLLPMRAQAMKAYELQDKLEWASREYERLRQWHDYLLAENEQLRQQAAMLHSELVQRGWAGSV